MASRKEYELLLRLEAETNGTFSRTFSKAQQEILSLQKDIQALNKVQGDITAYTKQQQAVEATNKKLDVLRQQYDNIQREISETGEYSSDLQNKLLAKQQQIDRTSEALEKQTQKLNQMGDALQEAGVDTNNLEKESQRLEAELGDLKQKQEQAADSAESFGSKSVQAFNAISEAIVAAGLAAALHEIYEGYALCIGVAADFEESMSNVEALSGASVDELGQLSSLAKELGATTKFTAKESADAMGYMAMAGWDAEQMLAGMPGVLQLAAASGEDLARVSDIVTDSMTAFGLSAADTNRYADVLAQTASKANTNVSLMGESFKYAAPLAGALKYDVEDVAVATGLMANAGIKGSEAGTTLRNIFTRLAKPTKESADAMDALGLSMSDGTGKMYTWMELMEQMRDSFAGLTEEQKTFYAAELAGQRGMSGLLAIVNASEEDFSKLSVAITNSAGAAQRMADIKLDNLNGQMTLFNSALEAVETTVGEQFTPDLQELYSIGAAVLGEVNSYLQIHPGIVKAGTVLIGGLGALTTGVLGVSAAIKVIKALNVASLLTGPAGIVLAVAGGVTALTAAIVGMNAEMNAGIPSVKELTEAARDMDKTIRDANDAMTDNATQMLATVRIADSYIDSLDALAPSIETNEENHAEYMRTLQLLVQAVPELADQIDLETGAIEGGTAALRENIAAWELNAKAQAYQTYLTSLHEAYNDVLTEQVANEIKLTQAQHKESVATEQQARVFKELLTRLDMTEEQFRSYYGTVGDIPWRQFGEDVKALKDEYAQYSDEIRIAQETQRNLNKAMAESADAVAEAEDAIAGAEAAYEDIVGPINDAADVTQALADVQSQYLADAVSEVSNRVALLVEEYNEAYDAALKSVGGQYEIWDEAEKVVAKSADSINKALESQAAYWSDYNDNLASLSARTGEIEGLSDVIASFADGSADSVNAIAGMASASDEDLKKMVENWKKVQEEQEAASGSIADLKTNFTQQMDELQQELADDIEAMDMSTEAALAGQKTIQAFIDSAAGMEAQVRAAYDRIGLAAASGLATASGTSIRLHTNTGGSYMVMGSGYASGTDRATPGAHLVGEHGPELAFFRGGEKVLDTERTRRLLAEAYTPEEAIGGAGSYNDESVVVSFAPVYHISGNMQPDEIEAVLREHDADLRDQIESVLADIRVDQKRGAY